MGCYWNSCQDMNLEGMNDVLIFFDIRFYMILLVLVYNLFYHLVLPVSLSSKDITSTEGT